MGSQVAYDEYFISNSESIIADGHDDVIEESKKTSEDLIHMLEKEGEIDLEKKSYIRELIISKLDEVIVGQDDAKKELARAITSGYMNLLNLDNSASRPLGVFFFAGPSGVGKTQIAKSLAKIFLGKEDRMQEIPCEKFVSGHEVSDLFGASKTYVGYGEAPDLADTKVFAGYNKRREELRLLTKDQEKELTKEEKTINNIVKRLNSLSFLVFNEIEKAHYKLYNSLLTVIDDGKAKMVTGKDDNKKCAYSNITDLSNTIIIMTSNVGNKTDKQSRGIGFTSKTKSSQDYMSSFKQFFPPEFIGRIKKNGKIVVFDKLDKIACKKILNNKTRELNTRIMESIAMNKQAALSVVVLDDVLDHIIDLGYDDDYGARSLGGTFDNNVTDKIELSSENEELYDKIETGYRYNLYVYLKDGEIKLNVKKMGKIEIPQKYIEEKEEEKQAAIAAALPTKTSGAFSLVNASGSKYSKKPILDGIKDDDKNAERMGPNFSIGNDKILKDFMKRIHPNKESNIFKNFMEGNTDEDGNIIENDDIDANNKPSFPKGFDSLHNILKEVQSLEIEYVKTYCMSYEEGIDCSDRLKEIISRLLFLGITEKDVKDLLKSAMIASIDYLGFIDSYHNIILTMDDDNNRLFGTIDNSTIKKMVNHFIREAIDMGLEKNTREMKEIISAIIYRIENLIDNTLNRKQTDALRELIARALTEC